MAASIGGQVNQLEVGWLENIAHTGAARPQVVVNASARDGIWVTCIGLMNQTKESFIHLLMQQLWQSGNQNWQNPFQTKEQSNVKVKLEELFPLRAGL